MQPFLISGLLISLVTFYSGMFVVPEKNKSFNEFQYQYLSKIKKTGMLQNFISKLEIMILYM